MAHLTSIGYPDMTTAGEAMNGAERWRTELSQRVHDLMKPETSPLLSGDVQAAPEEAIGLFGAVLRSSLSQESVAELEVGLHEKRC